LTNIDLKVLIS